MQNIEDAENKMIFDILKGLEDEPTTDVVPKSEVERLEHILDCYALQYGTVTNQREVIDKAKSEVAREIFEEIDNILYRFAYPSLTAIGTINVINAEGYHLRTRDYAELKKKYTEGDNEES